MLLEKIVCFCLLVVCGVSVVLLDIATMEGKIKPETVWYKVFSILSPVLCVVFFLSLYWLSILYK